MTNFIIKNVVKENTENWSLWPKWLQTEILRKKKEEANFIFGFHFNLFGLYQENIDSINDLSLGQTKISKRNT